ncbi:MAG: phosphoribosylamine--glycine ligase [Bdellovibrionaceae bacterium]|nr:phosphoribosylamine--glycine ligase [Pseudobdellovibrionaceae bacterium]
MRFLVIGSGGREHAIVRALSLSSSVSEIHAAPGSAGISKYAVCHEASAMDHSSIVSLVKQHRLDVVVIGPEDPLCSGLADTLRAEGIKTVGPSKEAAQLEGSKIFCKKFLKSAGAPTARYEVVESLAETMAASASFEAPFVFKVDGLAAGKGVYICQNESELEAAAKEVFEAKRFGAAGSKALLEEHLPGDEISYFVLTNGESYQALPLARDHKRLMDKDRGPNTGGMGAIAPFQLSASLQQTIDTKVVAPFIAQLKSQNLDYRGVIYFGFMVHDDVPNVLEINVRFGDPEAQVLLPLIDVDWGVLFSDLAEGRLSEFSTKPLCTACVVLAAEGYPEAPKKGVPIDGDLLAETSSSYFLHAGTKKSEQVWQTNGGRVLNSIGVGSTHQEAIQRAYAQSESANWLGRQMRRDIGSSVL